MTETRTDKTVDLVLYGQDELDLLKQTGAALHRQGRRPPGEFEADRRADRQASAAGAPAARPAAPSTAPTTTIGPSSRARRRSSRRSSSASTMPRKTFQGRDIEGLEISDDVNAPDDGRPVFLVVGVHHAREWPSAEIRMEFAQYLGQRLRQRPAHHRASSTSARVVVVPIINPDGFISLAQRRRSTRRLGRPGDVPSRRGVAPPAASLGLPPQELQRPGARPATPVRAPVRHRPEPQLRLRLGRPGRQHAPEHADLPRHRPVVRARDPGRPRALADPPGHVADHASTTSRARAAPARAARRTASRPTRSG